MPTLAGLWGRVWRKFVPKSRITNLLASHKRYLSGQPLRQEAFLAAAREYVSNRTDDENAWLYRKPYAASNHAVSFSELYQAINLIEAMSVPDGGRILEVGSGPGWITEILALLGYEVHAVEPCSDMVEIATARIASAQRHYRLKTMLPVQFHSMPLEQGLPLPDRSCDGVLFHAALHHIIDERAGLQECFRLMAPGAVLGISEGAWIPGDTTIEAALEDEMKRFGTLENPFTPEYLDMLLKETGFTEVTRYHSINGYFPVEAGGIPLEKMAQGHARTTNNVIARKSLAGIDTSSKRAVQYTRSRIELSDICREQDRISFSALLYNTGQTIWRSQGNGAVYLALQAGTPGSDNFVDVGWTALDADVQPGGSITLKLSYRLPQEGGPRRWSVDLVADGNFWFSAAGNRQVPLTTGKEP